MFANKDVQIAAYELAVLTAKKQPRGYVSEDVNRYHRDIMFAIGRAWPEGGAATCGYCPNCCTAACPNYRPHPLD